VAIAAGRLARDLGIPRVHLVVNRVRDGMAGTSDEARVRHDLVARGEGFAFDSTTWLPDDPAVLDAEPSVEPLLDRPETPFTTAVRRLAASIARAPQEAVTRRSSSSVPARPASSPPRGCARPIRRSSWRWSPASRIRRTRPPRWRTTS
jgi:hypothetical protein